MQDLKKDPAYGADCLRLWVASVDFGRDVNLGPKALANITEAHRKLRNCSRFMLANLSDGTEAFEPVPRSEMGIVSHLSLDYCNLRSVNTCPQVERYMMHEIYNLQKDAHEAYSTLSFPKGQMTRVIGCSHAHNLGSGHRTCELLQRHPFRVLLQRDKGHPLCRQGQRTSSSCGSHCFLTCKWPTLNDTLSLRLAQILDAMTTTLAPILPHLAEEVHATRQDRKHQFSVFQRGWQPLVQYWFLVAVISAEPTLKSDEWDDIEVEQKMDSMMSLRSVVMGLLERARVDKSASLL